eukprot:31316-Pelagococcus_subviridis.AAC.28
MTSPSSSVVMDPPPSLSKMANASLNSFTCVRVRYGHSAESSSSVRYFFLPSLLILPPRVLLSISSAPLARCSPSRPSPRSLSPVSAREGRVAPARTSGVRRDASVAERGEGRSAACAAGRRAAGMGGFGDERVAVMSDAASQGDFACLHFRCARVATGGGESRRGDAAARSRDAGAGDARASRMRTREESFRRRGWVPP